MSGDNNGKVRDFAIVIMQESFVFLGLNFFQPAAPYPFALQSSYQVHDTYEDEEEGSGKAEDGDPFTSIKLFHRATQSFGDQVHAGYHDQCKEEGEDQTEYNCPAQRPPEHHTIATKEYPWVKVLEQRNKIDVETHGQW